MPFIVATYVYASSQGQCTHSARTKMAFRVATYLSACSPRAAHALHSDQDVMEKKRWVKLGYFETTTHWAKWQDHLIVISEQSLNSSISLIKASS